MFITTKNLCKGINYFVFLWHYICGNLNVQNFKPKMKKNIITLFMAAAMSLAASYAVSAQSQSFKLGQWAEIHNAVLKELNRSYVDSLPIDRIMRASVDAMLEELGTPLDAVVALDADHDVLMARIAKRAEEQGRTDDTPEAIAKRLATYAKETAPLLDTYKSRGQLVAIDGVGEIDAIQKNIVAALDAR